MSKKMATNIYILSLEGGNYYVGKSDNPAQRFIQHINGEGSAWTKKHRPLKLLNIHENASPFDEDKHVKELMAKYGIDKVRGGAYVKVDLPEEQEDSLRHELRAATDSCIKCGKQGHFAKYCPKKSSFTATCGCGREFKELEEFMSHQRMCLPRNQKQEKAKPKKGTTYAGRMKDKEDEIIEYEEECETKKSMNYWAKRNASKKKQIMVYACDFCDNEYEDEDECAKHEKRCPRKPKSPAKKSGACYRCGRNSHWSPDCYATTHVDGYELSENEDSEDDDEDSD